MKIVSLIRVVESILINEGNHDPKFNWGDTIRYSPSEIGEILSRRADELEDELEEEKTAEAWIEKVGEIGMKIVKEGETVWFDCRSCGCLFRVGIHSVETPDDGKNYYAECPMCGSECHADILARDSNKVNKT